MAKATTTIKQVLNYQTNQSAWFAATQALFNQVAAFYFEVIAAHEQVLDLSDKEALTALEQLTHATQKNPTPIMPLSAIASEKRRGKASNSSREREGREISRCCRLPGRQRRRGTIYSFRKACRWQRAWHRSRGVA